MNLSISRRAALGALAFASGHSAPAVTPSDPNPGPPLRTAAQRDEARMALQRRLASGSADPVADAAEAARRGEFRLIVMGRFVALPTGVTCFTPYRGAPDFLVSHHQGDAPDERDVRWSAYAHAYNRALVNRFDYPDADLCRPAVDGEHAVAWTPNDLTRPARALDRPPGICTRLPGVATRPMSPACCARRRSMRSTPLP